MGATDADLADFFEVEISTIRLWMVQHPAFSDATQMQKGDGDDKAIRSLYLRACGYWIDTEQIFCHEGEVIRVPTRKWYPPDTAAAFIWLKNRRPDEWRDKHEHTVQVEVEHKFSLGVFDDHNAHTEKLASAPKVIEHSETAAS